MSEPTPRDADHDETSGDTWPWRCVGCGSTIFHDAEFCTECDPMQFLGDHGRSIHGPVGFLEWLRRESPPTFVLKVTAIAGIELSLTTLWLQVLLRGSLRLGRVVSLGF